MQAEIGERDVRAPCNLVTHHHRALQRLRHVGGARDLVHGAAKHAEFEPLRRAGIAEHHIAVMHPDAELDGAGLAASLALQRGEPVARGESSLERERASLRAAIVASGEEGEDRIADDVEHLAALTGS